MATKQPPLIPQHGYLSGNALVCGDNLDVLRDLPGSCIDLCYLDPPFNSKTFYVAAFGDRGRVSKQLRDVWKWTSGTEMAYQRLKSRPGKLLNAIEAIRKLEGPTTAEQNSDAAYAVFMGQRLYELHRVLKPNGSLYLHCDPTANWLLRILLDAVFGSGGFQNEIVWAYAPSGRGPSRAFHRKHDTIFYHSKGNSPTFNRQYTEMTEKTRATYSNTDEEGRLYKFSPAGISYLDEQKGRPVPSWWDDMITDVPSFGTATNAPERMGYPTQKPSRLLRRIIEASSNPGDLVLDPFCGCGTTVDVAAQIDRKYLGIDVSSIAVRVMKQRLESRGLSVAPEVHRLQWEEWEWDEFERRALMSRSETEDGVPGWEWGEDKVAGMLNAVPNEQKTGDGGIDARYYVESEREQNPVIPVQVKMWSKDRPVGRPEMDRLLGVQASLQNQGVDAPMAVMVTLYPVSESIRRFAIRQGRVELGGGTRRCKSSRSMRCW